VTLLRHLKTIQGDESDSTQRLLHLAAPQAPPTDLSFEPFSLMTAKSKLSLCALATLGPRDVRTGEPIDVAAMFHESPPSLPRIVKHDGDELSRSVANRLLHPRLSPTRLATALLQSPPQVAESHAIPARALTALGNGDPDTFLDLRRRRLAELSSAFFRKEAEIGADDSAPLDTIVVDEEAS
jgi:hypothetical protein